MNATDADPPRRAPLGVLLPTPRRGVAGFWISVAVHAAIVLILWTQRAHLIVTPTMGDPLLGTGGGGGGGGGGSAAQVATYIIALPPAPPPEEAVPTPVPPVVQPPKVETPVVKPVPAPVVADTTPASVAATATPGAGTSTGAGNGPGSGGGSGGGQGGGTGSGTGPGSGPGSGGGGGTIQPPVLRGLIMPIFKAPKELRGQRITVTLSILADGRVDRFETDPPITDRKYYDKLSEAILSYRFKPARNAEGQPVATVWPMVIILPSN